jgi:DNA-binding winged helix-turn-helix (wHTH) protein
MPKETTINEAGEVILRMLSRNIGKVVSHKALAKAMYAGIRPSVPLPASWYSGLSNQIVQLRKSIPSLRTQLVNVHGRGYTLGCIMVHR